MLAPIAEKPRTLDSTCWTHPEFEQSGEKKKSRAKNLARRDGDTPKLNLEGCLTFSLVALAPEAVVS